MSKYEANKVNSKILEKQSLQNVYDLLNIHNNLFHYIFNIFVPNHLPNLSQVIRSNTPTNYTATKDLPKNISVYDYIRYCEGCLR